MNKKIRFAALAMSAVMCIGTVTGCGGNGGNQTQTTTAAAQAGQQTTAAPAGDSGSGETAAAAVTTPDPVTLKVLMSGDKPNDWDAVLEEFYNRTKDTLNITFDWT